MFYLRDVCCQHSVGASVVDSSLNLTCRDLKLLKKCSNIEFSVPFFKWHGCEAEAGEFPWITYKVTSDAQICFCCKTGPGIGSHGNLALDLRSLTLPRGASYFASMSFVKGG